MQEKEVTTRERKREEQVRWSSSRTVVLEVQVGCAWKCCALFFSTKHFITLELPIIAQGESIIAS
jgi:hypothetical protein